MALDHYLAMCAGCREQGIEPVVTFHHFTTLRWVAAAGGRACTLDEPNVVATAGYLHGRFPPGERDPARRRQVNEVFVDAHAKATAAIKEAASVPVGLTLAMADDQAEPGGEAALAEYHRDWEEPYLEAARSDDFIGVQTCTRHRFGPQGTLDPAPGVPRTTMGYELWPQALGATIRRAATATGVPVLVTENGVATDDDAQRWAYGYRPTFGLVAVDRTTQVRTPSRARPGWARSRGRTRSPRVANARAHTRRQGAAPPRRGRAGLRGQGELPCPAGAQRG